MSVYLIKPLSLNGPFGEGFEVLLLVIIVQVFLICCRVCVNLG